MPCRYPTYQGHHNPTLTSVQKHQRVTGLKVALAAKLLQLAGKSKHAAALAHGFKTTKVMNTPRYVAQGVRPTICRLSTQLSRQMTNDPAEQDSHTTATAFSASPLLSKQPLCCWDKYSFPHSANNLFAGSAIGALAALVMKNGG